MIKGVGIDLVEISRFQSQEDLDHFLDQILSENEFVSLRENPRKSIIAAKIFAIKEAILKALGCGLHLGFYWREIELTEEYTPHLHGFLSRLAEEKAVSRIHISHSFSNFFSAAVVVLEE